MLAASLNHLVGGSQQRFWDGEAEGLGRTQVYHEVELGRLLHREVGRFSALENLRGIEGPDLPNGRDTIGGVTHQTSGSGEAPIWIYRRNLMARGQVCNLLGIPLEEDMRAYDERAGAALVEGREGRIDVGLAACFQDHGLPSECTRRRNHGPCWFFGILRSWINEVSNCRRQRIHLAQQVKPLSHEFAGNGG